MVVLQLPRIIGSFLFSSDYEKVEVLRLKPKRVNKKPNETFQDILPEPNPNKQNYRTEKEIMDTNTKSINHLMEEIKLVTKEKDAALEWLNTFKRLYDAYKQNPTTNRSYFGAGYLRGPFSCAHYPTA